MSKNHNKNHFAAAYIRVSTENQTELSPSSQLKIIRKFAGEKGYLIDEDFIFRDNGISGRYADKRPEFNRMISLAKQKPPMFSAVLVWKFSRFARNQEESIFYKSLLRKNGIEVISVSEPVDDGPFGKLIERIIEWSDEYYSIRLSGEVRRGMTEKAERGGIVSIAPFGYKVTDGRLVVDAEKARIVSKIFADFLNNKDINMICDNLNSSEIRTAKGNRWDCRAVEYILQNPVYIGKIRWNPILPQLIPVAVSALLTITNAIVENLPLLIESATLLVATLVQGLADALPTLIPTAVNAVMTIVQGLLDSLPSILDAGLELVSALAQGILDALPDLISKLPQIIMGIVTFLLNSIPQIIQTGIKLLTSLVGALPDIITSIVKAIPQIINGIINAVINSIPQIIQAGIDLLISLVKALPTIIVTIVNAIPDIISGIVNALIDNIPAIIQAGIDLLISLVKNLPTIIKGIVKAVPKIIEGIVKAFGSLMYKIVEIGGNIVKGLWDGICGLASWLWDSVSGWISGIWDGICDFFGIHSPSKEMAWVGEMLVKGLAGSIDKNGDMAIRAAEGMSSDVSSVMNSLADDMKTALPTDFSIDGNVKGLVDNSNSAVFGKSGLSLVLNIANFNNYSNDDISQLTNEIMETAGQFAKRKGMVFA